MKTYTEMTEIEAFLYRVISRIAECANSDLQPGDIGYCSKTEIGILAKAALTVTEVKINA